ncbi:MAG: hypothetical protein ACREPS_03720 [Rhodanobacteraceae bacterium]
MILPPFVDALVAAAHSADLASEQRQHGQALRDRVTGLVDRISKMMDMAAELANPAPALRKVDELERQRATALAALDGLVETIELDPVTHACLIHYRVHATAGRDADGILGRNRTVYPWGRHRACHGARWSKYNMRPRTSRRIHQGRLEVARDAKTTTQNRNHAER